MKPTPFQTLGALMIAAAATGSSYTFNVYKDALRKQFSLSINDTDTIAIACFSAGLLTWLPGLVADRLGPRLAVFLGGCLQASSFVLFWVVARLAVPSSQTAEILLCALSVTQYLGSGLTTAAVFSTVVRNFPKQRGLLTGLVKGWVGLCGGMITQMFVGFVYKPDDQPQALDFCLLAGLCAAGATLIPSQFMMLQEAPAPENADQFSRDASNRVKWGYLILLVMAAAVTSSLLLESIASHAVLVFLAALIVIIWLSPVLLSLRCLDAKEVEPLLSRSAVNHDDDDDDDEGGVDEGLTLMEMLCTVDCWLLLWSCITVIGAGIMVTTNAADMFGTVDGNSLVVPATTIFSLAQSFSRVLAGRLIDGCRARGRVGVIIGSIVLMLCAEGLFLIQTPTAILGGVLVAGIGFGATWPTMVVVVSELFGQKHLGSNYMIYDGTTSAVGALVFGKFVPEAIYNKWEGVDKVCHGPECFSLTYVILAGLLVSGLLCALLLLSRVWNRGRH